MSDLERFIAERIDELEKTQFASGPVIQDTGVSIALIQDGKLTLELCRGLRDRENRLLVTPATVFPIASITKSFAAASLAQVLTEKGLSLESQVSRVWPRFQLSRARPTKEASFVDLLSHRTGLPRHDALWYRSDLSADEIYSRLPGLEMTPPDGTGFRSSYQYNNILYGVCGKVQEELTGESWEAWIQKRFFAPLQMRETWVNYRSVPRDQELAKPYFRNLESVIFEQWSIAPAAAFFSTARSLARWLQCQMERGRAQSGKQVIASHLFEDWLWKQWNPGAGTPEAASCFERQDYGLGWFVDSIGGERVIHHGGSINGLSALAAFSPDRKVGLVILVNQVQSALPRKLARAVFAKLFGIEEPRDRFQLISVYSDKTLMPIHEGQAYEQFLPSPRLACDPEWQGAYMHPAYGELRIELRGERAELRLLGETWLIDKTSEGEALAPIDWIGMPSRLKIYFYSDRIEIPLNLHPGCERTRFIRAT